jgi:hypothetical protein
MPANKTRDEQTVELHGAVQAFIAAAKPRERMSVLLHVQPVLLPPSTAPRIPRRSRLPGVRPAPLLRNDAATKANMDTVSARLNEMAFVQEPNRLEAGLVFVVQATAAQLQQLSGWQDVLERINPNSTHKMPVRP